MAFLSGRHFLPAGASPPRSGRWQRYRELAAGLMLSAALSCSSSSKVPDAQKTPAPSCSESATLSDEMEYRLRMPDLCWVGMSLMDSGEVSALLRGAARDKRAMANVPAPGEFKAVFSDAGSALQFLRTEGAKEIGVLRYVSSAAEVDVSPELKALEDAYRGRGPLPAIPPFAVEIDFGSAFESEQEKSFAGKYFIGTNLLVFNPKGMHAHEVQKGHVAGHELMHYFSWVNHGGSYYYMGRDSRGAFIATDRSLWLEEGLASLVAYRLFADPRERVPYPHFTSSALLMEQVAGFDAVLEAARSGDVRRIQWSLEQKFEGQDFHELASGSYTRGPLFFPLMELARKRGLIEMLDSIAEDGMMVRICESPPKDFSCAP